MFLYNWAFLNSGDSAVGYVILSTCFTGVALCVTQMISYPRMYQTRIVRPKGAHNWCSAWQSSTHIHWIEYAWNMANWRPHHSYIFFNIFRMWNNKMYKPLLYNAMDWTRGRQNREVMEWEGGWIWPRKGVGSAPVPPILNPSQAWFTLPLNLQYRWHRSELVYGGSGNKYSLPSRHFNMPTLPARYSGWHIGAATSLRRELLRLGFHLCCVHWPFCYREPWLFLLPSWSFCYIVFPLMF